MHFFQSGPWPGLEKVSILIYRKLSSAIYRKVSSVIFRLQLGRFIKKINIKNVILTGVLAALFHWIITDFGVWMDGRIYPMNSAGFVACFVAALPYLENMLIANLVFCGIMFGVFELAERKFPMLSLNNAQ